ncbi:hypothetical protein BDZ45DRAFT_725244 [Acephala macrosclerotiorum]|nr:hypothetical protein BDZ45DRAFT_725244 [Acephala macrosclerotiorum]
MSGLTLSTSRMFNEDLNMATVSIDYDSKGDVELILEQKNFTANTPSLTAQHLQPLSLPKQTDANVPPSHAQEKPTKYTVGPLGIKVNRFRLRVSSLKLISSSRYFQAMLEGSGFRECKELQEHGSVSIELLSAEDDPTAMMIVLGILHGNDVDLPADLNLSTLHKVAVVVDKYQWHALVAPHATSWFDKLVASPGLPDIFNETLLQWLWITWLFGMSDHFRTLSKVAQQDAKNSIDLTDESIRVPTRALKAINKRREAAFQEIEHAIKEFQNCLVSSENRQTDTLPEQKMLRCMAIGLAAVCSQDLELGEYAVADHAKSSIRSLISRIDLLQSMQCFEVTAPSGGNRHIFPGGSWDLKDTLLRAISGLKIDEWGLNYEDFKPARATDRLDRVDKLK